MATDRLGSLLIITEDSGAEGHATIVAVVKRMLQLIRATALRTIATKLGRKDGFVLFHIDGDQTWTERRSSENVELFRKRVIEPIEIQ